MNKILTHLFFANVIVWSLIYIDKPKDYNFKDKYIWSTCIHESSHYCANKYFNIPTFKVEIREECDSLDYVGITYRENTECSPQKIIISAIGYYSEFRDSSDIYSNFLVLGQDSINVEECLELGYNYDNIEKYYQILKPEIYRIAEILYNERTVFTNNLKSLK
jgi:hypothetical protein